MNHLHRLFTISLLVIGITTSGYLLWRHSQLSEGGKTSADACSTLLGSGCDATLQSDWSIVLGLPLAGWGLVYYTVIAELLVSGRLLGREGGHTATTTAWFLAALGAVASVLLFVLMAKGLAPFCPLCATVHTVNLALPFALGGLWPRQWVERAGQLLAALRWCAGREPAAVDQAPLRLVALVMAGLVGVVVYQWVLVEYVRWNAAEAATFSPRQTVRWYEVSQTHEIPLGPADLTRGPADAPVRLVVFSDFGCPACYRFTGTLDNLAERFGNQLQIVYKHFPLNSECNDSVGRDLHPGACRAARAAEAAARQDAFWEYHDEVFQGVADKGPVRLSQIAARLQLDVDRFEQELEADEIAERVAADVELGRRVGVASTPSVFINGRSVADPRKAALEVLVDFEIKKQKLEELQRIAAKKAGKRATATATRPVPAEL